MLDSASNNMASIGSMSGKNSCAVLRYYNVTRPEGPPPMTATRIFATFLLMLDILTMDRYLRKERRYCLDRSCNRK